MIKFIKNCYTKEFYSPLSITLAIDIAKTNVKNMSYYNYVSIKIFLKQMASMFVTIPKICLDNN